MPQIILSNKLISQYYDCLTAEIATSIANSNIGLKFQNLVKLAHKTCEILFNHVLHSSVSEKIRELVGEIKYAFAMITDNRNNGSLTAKCILEMLFFALWIAI